MLIVSTGALLTTPEIARLLRVSPRTVQRWWKVGWITPELVTPTGQARWVEASVRDQLRELNERRRREQE